MWRGIPRSGGKQSARRVRLRPFAQLLTSPTRCACEIPSAPIRSGTTFQKQVARKRADDVGRPSQRWDRRESMKNSTRIHRIAGALAVGALATAGLAACGDTGETEAN